MVDAAPLASAWALAARKLRAARPRKLRGLREWAAAEIVIPTGPYRGRRFAVERQPFAGLLFDAIDSGRWRRVVVTGPSQSGKSLASWAIPALWLLCEWREPVILAAPTKEQAAEKWRQDLVPILAASSYAWMLPRAGDGSRGGDTSLLTLDGGGSVKFMGARGGDKARASSTARAALMTETDGMDEATGESRESDPITQIEQRTQAYVGTRLVVLECTPSTPTGRIWTEYQAATASRIACPCPACRAYVTPEREHLRGWQDAPTAQAAGRAGRWCCPACGHQFTEAQRFDAARRGVLVHRGQDVDRRGRVTGPEPDTDTLGFRWGAFHNLLGDTAHLAALEWSAAHAAPEHAEDRDRALRQFHHALPAAPRAAAADQDADVDVLERVDQGTPRGVVPERCGYALTVGVDVGRHVLHWCAVAWARDGTGHVVDYGIQDVPAGLAEERGIQVALRCVRDLAAAGWKYRDGTRPADLVAADAGYLPDAVQGVAAESGPLLWPTKGMGRGQATSRAYLAPRSTGAVVQRIGDGWHLVRLPKRGRLVEFDADRWKSWARARINAPPGVPGSWTLYAAGGRDHAAFAAHLRSERRVVEWDPRKGQVERWQQRRAANHWLDAHVLACLAAALRGVQVLDPATGATVQAAPAPQEPSTADPAQPARPAKRGRVQIPPRLAL